MHQLAIDMGYQNLDPASFQYGLFVTAVANSLTSPHAKALYEPEFHMTANDRNVVRPMCCPMCHQPCLQSCLQCASHELGSKEVGMLPVHW